MALSIKNPEAERLARRLAERTGETITDAVLKALRERLQREEGRSSAQHVREELLEIAGRCAA